MRDVSLLTHALHDLRLALRRLGREIMLCLVVIFFTWQLMWELATRLVHTLF